MIFRIILKWQLLAGPYGLSHYNNATGYRVQQIMISHYATRVVMTPPIA